MMKSQLRIDAAFVRRRQAELVLSVQDLAAQAGLSRCWLWKALCGATLSAAAVRRLAAALRVPPSRIVAAGLHEGADSAVLAAAGVKD